MAFEMSAIGAGMVLAVVCVALIFSTWAMAQGLADLVRFSNADSPPQHKVCVPPLTSSPGAVDLLVTDSPTTQRILGFEESDTVVGSLRAPDDPRLFLQAAPETRLVERNGALGHIWTDITGDVTVSPSGWRMVSFGFNAELHATLHLLSLQTQLVGGEHLLHFQGPVTGAPRLDDDTVDLANIQFRWADITNARPVEMACVLIGTSVGGEVPHLRIELKFPAAVLPLAGTATVHVLGSFDYVPE